MFQHTYPIRGGLAALSFQAGVYHRLSADPTLASLAPGGIHDMMVPQAANQGKGVAYPYVVVRGATEVPQDRLTTTANNVSVPIDVFSTYHGSKEAQIIANRIMMLLNRQEKNLQISGWILNKIVFETAQAFEESGIIQVQARYGGLLQPIPYV